MGKTLIKIAAVYLVIGVLLGYYMSVAANYVLTGVHAHLNLLGWATLGLTGIIYHVFPDLENNIWAKLHFWLHNIGLPIMMIALALLIAAGMPLYPLVAIGATLTVVGIIAFLINVLLKLK